MFNLYKNKPSFPIIKDNKTNDKGRGGGSSILSDLFLFDLIWSSLIQFDPTDLI